MCIRDSDGIVHEVAVTADQALVELPADGWSLNTANRTIAFAVDGHTQSFRRIDRSELWAPTAADRAGSGNALTSPFPAAVAEVHVAPGDAVETGQVLVVIEAMKMLHSLKADGAATIAEVLVSPGDHVTGGQSLITFESEEPTDL